MITQKKEEAKAATEAAVIADTGDKVNVLDIKVEDNFDIDDIWVADRQIKLLKTLSTFQIIKIALLYISLAQYMGFRV